MAEVQPDRRIGPRRRSEGGVAELTIEMPPEIMRRLEQLGAPRDRTAAEEAAFCLSLGIDELTRALASVGRTV